MTSERHGVAAKVIATVDDLDRIAADDEADVPALHGWRRELFGEKALALKHGRLALAIEKGRVVPVERLVAAQPASLSRCRSSAIRKPPSRKSMSTHRRRIPKVLHRLASGLRYRYLSRSQVTMHAHDPTADVGMRHRRALDVQLVVLETHEAHLLAADPGLVPGDLDVGDHLVALEAIRGRNRRSCCAAPAARSSSVFGNRPVFRGHQREPAAFGRGDLVAARLAAEDRRELLVCWSSYMTETSFQVPTIWPFTSAMAVRPRTTQS